MAIDGSAFNSDDRRAISVACHGCRTMGSSDAPISSHKSPFLCDRQASSFFQINAHYSPQGTLRYHTCSTAMTSGRLYRSLSPGESCMCVRANKSARLKQRTVVVDLRQIDLRRFETRQSRPQNDCGGLFTGIGCVCCWR